MYKFDVAKETEILSSGLEIGLMRMERTVMQY